MNPSRVVVKSFMLQTMTTSKETLSSPQDTGSKSYSEASFSGESDVLRLLFQRMVENSCKSSSMLLNS